MAIENEDELFPKDILSSELNKIKPPDFSLEENRNTPYAVLADLNLPIYITTNYDYSMEAALESRGKKPPFAVIVERYQNGPGRIRTLSSYSFCFRVHIRWKMQVRNKPFLKY